MLHGDSMLLIVADPSITFVYLIPCDARGMSGADALRATTLWICSLVCDLVACTTCVVIVFTIVRWALLVASIIESFCVIVTLAIRVFFVIMIMVIIALVVCSSLFVVHE